jgi:hypothetical protein
MLKANEIFLEWVNPFTKHRMNQRPQNSIDSGCAPDTDELTTLAIWLYGPMGRGVLGGVEVSTLDGIFPPSRMHHRILHCPTA